MKRVFQIHTIHLQLTSFSAKMWIHVVQSGLKWVAKNATHNYIKKKEELMFLGQYHHSIDNKGRLTIPSNFREELKDGAYLMVGFDQNLMLFPQDAFQKMVIQTSAISHTDPTARDLNRLIYSNAKFVEVDNNGRILIPPFLREIIGLKIEAILAGVGVLIEIWPPDAWQPYKDQLKNLESRSQRFEGYDLTFE
jgi:MraZ protein